MFRKSGGDDLSVIGRLPTPPPITNLSPPDHLKPQRSPKLFFCAQYWIIVTSLLDLEHHKLFSVKLWALHNLLKSLFNTKRKYFKALTPYMLVRYSLVPQSTCCWKWVGEPVWEHFRNLLCMNFPKKSCGKEKTSISHASRPWNSAPRPSGEVSSSHLGFEKSICRKNFFRICHTTFFYLLCSASFFHLIMAKIEKL